MIRMGVNISLSCNVGAPVELALRLLPAQTAQQRIGSEVLLVPADARALPVRVGRHGQRLLDVQAAAGMLDIACSALVDLSPHFADPASLDETSVTDLPFEVLPFLHESPLCPTEAMTRLAYRTFGRMRPGYARVATLCACVRDRTLFDPSLSGMPKTALDTLLDKRGASEHFAQLAIALCRALFIPARLVSTARPDDSGLHYCMEAYVGNRWFLFDPTGLAPAWNLIRIATGRDSTDMPAVGLHGQTYRGGYRLTITALHATRGAHEAAVPDGAAVSIAPPERTDDRQDRVSAA